MIEAELRLLGADHAEAWLRGKPWVAVLVVSEVDHTLLSVSGAKLHLVATGHAEARPRSAP